MPGLLATHQNQNHPFLFSPLPPAVSQDVMGTPQRVLLAPWALLPLLAVVVAVQLAGASHVIHRSLEAEAAPPSVPASIVSPLLRTGYHFQPPRNWINGTAAASSLEPHAPRTLLPASAFYASLRSCNLFLSPSYPLIAPLSPCVLVVLGAVEVCVSQHTMDRNGSE